MHFSRWLQHMAGSCLNLCGSAWPCCLRSPLLSPVQVWQLPPEAHWGHPRSCCTPQTYPTLLSAAAARIWAASAPSRVLAR